jgi:hypothetical protein
VLIVHANKFRFLRIEKRDLLILLSDGLSIRMALCPHNLLLEVLKIDVGEVHETKFQGVERPCELIFSIVDIKKGVLDELP